MTDVLPEMVTGAEANRSPIVNDFAITFCTVNGSGSATANTTLMRSIFKMGIPVSGKNIFPSNIQGLPTWYTVRVSKDGFIGRVEKDDLVVAMNPATFVRDMEYLVPGGVIFYPDDIKTPITRTDLVAYPMPVKQLTRNTDVPPALRDFIANMVYVGVVAQILGIDLEVIRYALNFHFKGKKTPVESNFSVVKSAYDWAAENLEKKDPYQVERMHLTDDMIMSDGNVAGALGTIYGGVQFVSWYPITPASTLPESLHEFLPVLRKDKETGKQNYVIVQAEDELAAIGMVVGAGWAGLRAMTATSGPGLSLMTEYLGLAYFAEVPVVLWDVQRVGPSTGLPTRTAQGDLTLAYFDGHGDTNFVILIPGNVNECFDFGWQALDLAERLQTPVVVLSDLDLGMNQWMANKFEYPDRPMDRGKIMWEEELEKRIQEGGGKWGRYLDVDGDGIPYRTVPGNQHPRSSYFARGTGHDEYGRYSEENDVWEHNLDRLKRKYITAKQYVPKSILKTSPGARFGIVSIGSSDAAIEEARFKLAQKGIPVDHLRVRALPFTAEVEEFIKNHEYVYVVELNRDGQLRQLLTLEYPEMALKLRKASHTDGLPLSANWVRDAILSQEEK
jgi:2-oxoglutarate/2-oxoacid ferredoxin oxidoreductase subunit alpha